MMVYITMQEERQSREKKEFGELMTLINGQ